MATNRRKAGRPVNQLLAGSYLITLTGDIYCRDGGVWRVADPLERLGCLSDLSSLTPEIRADALAELLAAGWTRDRVAEALGISPQRVTQWSRGGMRVRSRAVQSSRNGRRKLAAVDASAPD
jgi:hypothetical protein